MVLPSTKDHMLHAGSSEWKKSTLLMNTILVLPEFSKQYPDWEIDQRTCQWTLIEAQKQICQPDVAIDCANDHQGYNSVSQMAVVQYWHDWGSLTWTTGKIAFTHHCSYFRSTRQLLLIYVVFQQEFSRSLKNSSSVSDPCLILKCISLVIQ